MTETNLVSLLPENFKVIRDKAATTPLEKYTLNPLLLTSFLLDEANSNPYVDNIEDFRRSFRLPDTILNASMLFQPEAYKGFLAFKSTKYDLIYYLRQIGLDTVIEELAPSGLIDIGASFRFIDGSWSISPNNSNINSLIQIGNLVNTNASMNKSCEVGLKVTINIQENGEAIDQITVVYNKISQLLLNRLSATTVLGSLTFEINVTNYFNFDDIKEVNQYVFSLEPAVETWITDTQIDNATPLMINPNGFLINGYRLTDVYQVN